LAYSEDVLNLQLSGLGQRRRDILAEDEWIDVQRAFEDTVFLKYSLCENHVLQSAISRGKGELHSLGPHEN
jgi:hypothetical protein